MSITRDAWPTGLDQQVNHVHGVRARRVEIASVAAL